MSRLRRLLLITLLTTSCTSRPTTVVTCSNVNGFASTLQQLNLSSDWSELTRDAVDTAWRRPFSRFGDVTVFEEYAAGRNCRCLQSASYVDGHLHQITLVRREATYEDARYSAQTILEAITPSDPDHTVSAGPEDFRTYRWTLPGGRPQRLLGVDFDISPCETGWSVGATISLFSATRPE